MVACTTRHELRANSHSGQPRSIALDCEMLRKSVPSIDPSASAPPRLSGRCAIPSHQQVAALCRRGHAASVLLVESVLLSRSSWARRHHRAILFGAMWRHPSMPRHSRQLTHTTKTMQWPFPITSISICPSTNIVAVHDSSQYQTAQ